MTKLYSESHLKTELNASFPLIDPTEHSGQLAEMLAAPMDCYLYQLTCIQNMMQSGLLGLSFSNSDIDPSCLRHK